MQSPSFAACVLLALAWSSAALQRLASSTDGGPFVEDAMAQSAPGDFLMDVQSSAMPVDAVAIKGVTKNDVDNNGFDAIAPDEPVDAEDKEDDEEEERMHEEWEDEKVDSGSGDVDADAERGDENEKSEDSPVLWSSLIAVISKADNVERRSIMRKTFEAANLGGNFSLRFVLCKAPPAGSGEGADILVLPCEEGFGARLLTSKTQHTMEAFQRYFPQHSLLIMAEDDTFVAWHRLQLFLESYSPSKDPDHYKYAYMGIAKGAGEPVNRVEGSPTYQSLTTYNKETYPAYMESTFVILGTEVVHRILGEHVPEHYVLSNRDQALGVWVQAVKQLGVEVHYVSLPGLHKVGNGEWLGCGKKWEDYPFFVQHGVAGDTAQCLAKADVKNDANESIEKCYPECKDMTPSV